MSLRPEELHRRLDDLDARDPMRSGAQVRIVSGERLQLLHQRVPAGATVPPHEHDNEQLTVVLSGRLRAVVEGIEVVIGADEVLLVPAGATHSVEVLDDLVAVEIFAPPRPELEK